MPSSRALTAHLPSVSAVILAFNRERSLRDVLARLEALPLLEVLVVDNASTDGTAALVDGWGGRVRRVDPGGNLGAAGRNHGAEAARGELLLMLDDDSWPLAGAVEAMAAAFAADPRLGALGGLVADVDDAGRVLRERELGTFDWFLRGDHRGPAPEAGIPTFFFPEGASMLRRTAYLECGGCFAPYFFNVTEVDLSTRLLGAGWDVRYLPQARFEHRKDAGGRAPAARVLRFGVRNQIWYFWRHFPAALAARRIVAYGLFDLVMCTAYGAPGAWAGGIAAAWRDRAQVRGTRHALPRDVTARAERGRGRLHRQLLRRQLGRRLRRVPSRRGAR